jgi:hypothetical protein
LGIERWFFVKMRIGIGLLAVAAIIPVGAVVGTGVAGAAKAPKPSLSCKVSGSATISPGVSETPNKQTLSVTLTLSGCTDSSVAGITGAAPGSSTATGKTAETCANLTEAGKPIKTTTTIDWNNGSTSGVTYKTILNSGSGTAAGKVTSGSFDKGKIASSVTYTAGAGQNCISTPLTSATISGTFTIS